MAGIINEPTAEVVALAEPEMAAKNMQVAVVAMPRPPATQPISSLKKSTRRLAIPPLFIRFPAMIKKGIAISGKESRAVNAFWGRIFRESFVIEARTTVVATPRETPMGIPMIINRASRRNSTMTSVTPPTSLSSPGCSGRNSL